MKKIASDVRTPEQAWRALFAAILGKTISDMAYESYANDARWFASSSMCVEICDELGVSHDALVRKMDEVEKTRREK